MRDPAVFKEHLGKSESYTDYLHFFQDKITSRGVEEVVREYLFNGDEQADDLLGRLYSGTPCQRMVLSTYLYTLGFEHPILHLGFGLEFQQPCLVAEALASAAIHDTWPLPIVLPTEAYLKAHPNTQQTSLVSLLPALQSIPVIASAVKSSKHPDRVIPFMKHAGDALPPLLSQWRVEPTEEDIKYRTAEMANVCAYMIGAAQHPRKKPAIEFFMMHSMNLSAFFGVFMQAQWLTLKQRARLLTWKGWMDLALYAANACPTLYPERIATYVPKQPGGWDMIVARVNRYPDDGHTCKLIRALLNARNLSALYSAEGRSELPLREEDFLAVAHMAMDSVERMLEPGYKMPDHLIQLYRGVLGVDEEVVKIVARFVRWCGSEDSWEGFPDLPSAEEEKAKL